MSPRPYCRTEGLFFTWARKYVPRDSQGDSKVKLFLWNWRVLIPCKHFLSWKALFSDCQGGENVKAYVGPEGSFKLLPKGITRNFWRSECEQMAPYQFHSLQEKPESLRWSSSLYRVLNCATRCYWADCSFQSRLHYNTRTLKYMHGATQP